MSDLFEDGIWIVFWDGLPCFWRSFCFAPVELSFVDLLSFWWHFGASFLMTLTLTLKRGVSPTYQTPGPPLSALRLPTKLPTPFRTTFPRRMALIVC